MLRLLMGMAGIGLITIAIPLSIRIGTLIMRTLKSPNGGPHRDTPS